MNRDQSRLGAATCFVWLVVATIAGAAVPPVDEPADLILFDGRVITVDKANSVAQALAVRGGRILRVGPDDAVLQTRGPATRTIDLHGAVVMPGLIDSHVHPNSAAMYEFAHPVPDIDSIGDLLAYIRGRAAGLVLCHPFKLG